jgi:hypothetical protein
MTMSNMEFSRYKARIMALGPEQLIALDQTANRIRHSLSSVREVPLPAYVFEAAAETKL